MATNTKEVRQNNMSEIIPASLTKLAITDQTGESGIPSTASQTIPSLFVEIKEEVQNATPMIITPSQTNGAAISTTVVPTTFTKFSKPPAELRIKIWNNFDVEPRVVRLLHEYDEYDEYADDTTIPVTFEMIRIRGQHQIPAILQVNRESREEGLKVYVLITEGDQPVYFSPEYSMLVFACGVAYWRHVHDCMNDEANPLAVARVRLLARVRNLVIDSCCAVWNMLHDEVYQPSHLKALRTLTIALDDEEDSFVLDNKLEDWKESWKGSENMPTVVGVSEYCLDRLRQGDTSVLLSRFVEIENEVPSTPDASSERDIRKEDSSQGEGVSDSINGDGEEVIGDMEGCTSTAEPVLF